jgi:hypothetical protein
MAVTPAISSIPAKISPAADVTRANLPLSSLLSPGEKLMVSVVDKLSSNQYRVSFKNVSLTATSDIPLQIGEKLQVKVHAVMPQIVLSLGEAQRQSAEMKIQSDSVAYESECFDTAFPDIRRFSGVASIRRVAAQYDSKRNGRSFKAFG